MVLDSRTAMRGASYIACEASHAFAGAHLLEIWADYLKEESAPLDGVLIGCFGDPGLFALRESSSSPVTGLAEASFIQASKLGPFSVVTGGARWKPMLERLAMALGFNHQLLHIETVEASGAELQANPKMAIECLTNACRAAAVPEAKSIILGGAGLAGYASPIQSHIQIPLIDSAVAGLTVLLSKSTPAPQRISNGFVAKWTNVPESMQGLSK